jgi:hypothetical protein
MLAKHKANKNLVRIVFLNFSGMGFHPKQNGFAKLFNGLGSILFITTFSRYACQAYLAANSGVIFNPRADKATTMKIAVQRLPMDTVHATCLVHPFVPFS